jgi:hypothetical protein
MAIKAEMILDSMYPTTCRVSTLLVTMPTYILAEFNKHRVFESNTSSSRAIPTATLLEQVRTDPVIPVHWGVNQAGMEAKEEEVEGVEEARKVWWHLVGSVTYFVEQLANLNLHKQVTNRPLAPFMWSTVIVTATEWDNFFAQRLAKDADPMIQAAAKEMYEALAFSVPVERKVHLPFVSDRELVKYTQEECTHMSVARCARVSYKRHNDDFTLEQDTVLSNRCKDSGHWTPLGHQLFAGKDDQFFHGCMRGWLQLRQVLNNKPVMRAAEGWKEAMA